MKYNSRKPAPAAANAHELASETTSKAKYIWDPSSNGTDSYGDANHLNQYPNGNSG